MRHKFPLRFLMLQRKTNKMDFLHPTLVINNSLTIQIYNYSTNQLINQNNGLFRLKICI